MAAETREIDAFGGQPDGGKLGILSATVPASLLGRVLSRSYQLLDFGNGRKLESLAGRLIDRPCPAADQATPRQPALWKRAESRFDLSTKSWLHRTPWPEDLLIEIGPHGEREPGGEDKLSAGEAALRLPVQPTPFGHIGVFPEQADNWQWLIRTAPEADLSPRSKLRQALNLFAYTGASSMAMAGSGMHVAHVDAAKPNVEAAKRLALANRLEDAPVRYLVDDAAAFVQREIRRGNRYHTIVMDPPAYGHGPKSKRSGRNRGSETAGSGKRPAQQARAWRLGRDLPDLIRDCFELLSTRAFRLLVTGHSAEMDQADVLDLIQRKLANRRIGRLQPQFETGRMSLVDRSGRKLDAGFFVRCAANADSTEGVRIDV